MKYLVISLSFIFSQGLSAQFLGGDGSGQTNVFLASAVGCNSFLGGDGSGQTTIVLPSTVNCSEFLGSEGSGAATAEHKGQCVMYWGDTGSGYDSAWVATTNNCIFFKGNEASGYAVNQFTNMVPCFSFTASANGDDGFAARSFTEDNGGLCITVPIESSPLFGEVVNDDDGFLHWKTYAELNNEGFEIYKSLDGIHWHLIGWVAGAGNSIENQSYSFWDYNLSEEVQYYRFVQLDFDGTESFSNVVALSINDPNFQRDIVQIYPNPVISGNDLNVQAWLQSPLALGFKVRNTLGQLLFSGKYDFLAGNDQFSIATQGLPSGTYFLSIESTSSYWVMPFVVLSN